MQKVDLGALLSLPSRFAVVLELCASVGVHTSPVRLAIAGEKLLVVPLFAWYTTEWGGEASPALPPARIERDVQAKASGQRCSSTSWSQETHGS